MTGTKRERLLDWIRNGSTKSVPVLMGPGFELASAYLGKDQRKTTWADAIRAAEETGTHNIACLSQPMPFDAIEFLEDIELSEKRDRNPDGIDRLTQWVRTPEGTMRDVREFPKDTGSYWREHFVKSDGDLPAFAYLIRRTTHAVVNTPAVRRKVDARIKSAKAAVGDAFPTEIHVFCPAVDLIGSYYNAQQTGLFLVYDHRDLMEELMDCYWRMVQVWLEIAAANDLDIYNYAINGFEWLNPDLYERYLVPQAKRINEFAKAHGKLSWVHTCGKMKKIAKMEAYQRMAVDVVESLSSPPTGDIDDLAETRRDIGQDIVTRGGINCEFFYDRDLEALRRQTHHVLDSVEGYKHAVGDTNPSYPSYPWENTQTVIDVVRERGLLLD